MNDTIQLEVARPRAVIADVWFDPMRNMEWMEDTRIEPMGDGRFRMTGGGMAFTMTVVSQRPPDEMTLRLDGPGVTVDIHAQLIALTPEKTLLVSKEVFRFAGVFGPLKGMLARPFIRKAHRAQMTALKEYAERQP